MKKILFVLLASVLLFATACNGETSAPSNPSTPSNPPAPTMTESELNNMNSIAMPTDYKPPNEEEENLVKEVFDVLISGEKTRTNYNNIYINEYNLYTNTIVETSTSAVHASIA